jgi:hypothetical protein
LPTPKPFAQASEFCIDFPRRLSTVIGIISLSSALKKPSLGVVKEHHWHIDNIYLLFWGEEEEEEEEAMKNKKA